MRPQVWHRIDHGKEAKRPVCWTFKQNVSVVIKKSCFGRFLLTFGVIGYLILP